MYAEPLTELPPILNEREMKRYSDLEIDLLIDEISEAALEAIEQAAGEAAKAAVLSVIEREAAAVYEAAHQQAEAQKWRMEAEKAQSTGKKNSFITGVICFLSGFATGIIIMGVVK
jgi:hypothetical protein